jgi:hypothetical protein
VTAPAPAAAASSPPPIAAACKATQPCCFVHCAFARQCCFWVARLQRVSSPQWFETLANLRQVSAQFAAQQSAVVGQWLVLDAETVFFLFEAEGK